jgi:hypothetical protein
MSEHKRGWLRSFYYFMNWEYDSKNDIPSERDVKLKQTCMRQVSLSRLKLRKVRINPRNPPDLQPIIPKPGQLDVKTKTIDIFKNYEIVKETTNHLKEKENVLCVPPNSPTSEISQKQLGQLNSYKSNSRYR